MNELYNTVKPDLESKDLVEFAAFYDERDLLVTAGRGGVYIAKFNYQSKYTPQLALKVDPRSLHVKISLVDCVKVEKSPDLIQGMKIDRTSQKIVYWARNADTEIVGFNGLTA